MDKVQYRKVLLSGLLVIGLDLLIGVIGLLAVLPELSADTEEAARQVAALAITDRQLLLSMLFGTLTTALGGYVCARWVKQDVFVNALALGVVGLLASVLFFDDASPFWYTVTGFLMVIPATLGGAVVAEQLHRRP